VLEIRYGDGTKAGKGLGLRKGFLGRERGRGFLERRGGFEKLGWGRNR
jgi:hypothetical protein